MSWILTRPASGVLLQLAVLLASTMTAAHAEEPSPLMLEGDPDTLARDLQSFTPALMIRGHVPGLSMAVIREGRVIWHQGFGVKNTRTGEPVTSETIFEAASLTKPLFAYAVMQLVEAGVLDLDTPLVRYLPEEEVRKMIGHPLDQPGFHREWLDAVTGRHILSHSSGFPHGEPRQPSFPIFFEPGTDYKYSAAGYYFLQLVVEHLLESPLETIIQEHVLDPLEMSHSSMVWRDVYDSTAAQGHGTLGEPEPFRRYTEAHAAASLYTTAPDYAGFVCAVLNHEGLADTTVARMLSPQIDVEGPVSWSLGFGRQDDENGSALWQWGDYGIFRNFVIAYEESGAGLVYLTNSIQGLSIGPELVTHAIGGAAHGLSWLDYPSYDAPVTQLTWILLEEGSDVALARLPSLRGTDPERISEGDLNRLGYQLLTADRFDDAVAVLQVNVDEHPTSANAHDSLGEAYMRRGADSDIDRASACYRKALEILPQDEGLTEAFREGLRRNAEEKLAELEALREND